MFAKRISSFILIESDGTRLGLVLPMPGSALLGYTGGAIQCRMARLTMVSQLSYIDNWFSFKQFLIHRKLVFRIYNNKKYWC